MPDVLDRRSQPWPTATTSSASSAEGAWRTVYLAQDLKHDRPVALKVLHPELGMALGPERFLREIQYTARLQHPHILTVLDSGTAGEVLYYVMPYIEGE